MNWKSLQDTEVIVNVHFLLGRDDKYEWQEWSTIKTKSDKFCLFLITTVTIENFIPSCYIDCTMNYFSIELNLELGVSGHM